MTAVEFKHRQQAFTARLKQLRQSSFASLVQENTQQQELRIRYLLKPQNYAAFFTYYFGKDGGGLATAPCAPFHVQAYQDLYAHAVINQFRLWFRGAAKSIQTNLGNVFALKCTEQMHFMLLVGINQWRARLLMADLQLQLQANERIIKDFGQQVSYGSWREGAFETQDGCYFMALGINQSFRGLRRLGHRVDLAVVDDVEDLKVAANTKLVQEYSYKIVRDLQQAFARDRRRLIIANNYITDQGIVARFAGFA